MHITSVGHGYPGAHGDHSGGFSRRLHTKAGMGQLEEESLLTIKYSYHQDDVSNLFLVISVV